jgi:parvulin-like peptidyl-prolyl isomerase
MRSSRVVGLALTAVVLAAAARADVVERIAAVVDGRPVLQSDVLLLAHVRGLAPDMALEAVIEERLMYAEASRAAQAAATPAEEEKAVARLYEERPDLREAVPEADLRRLVKRQLTIVKYVEFRFRPQVRVTPEELEQAYAEEHEGEAEAPPLAAVAPALEEKLTRKALDERLETWVRDLRAGAEIRYNR